MDQARRRGALILDSQCELVEDRVGAFGCHDALQRFQDCGVRFHGYKVTAARSVKDEPDGENHSIIQTCSDKLRQGCRNKRPGPCGEPRWFVRNFDRTDLDPIKVSSSHCKVDGDAHKIGCLRLVGPPVIRVHFVARIN